MLHGGTEPYVMITCCTLGRFVGLYCMVLVIATDVSTASSGWRQYGGKTVLVLLGRLPAALSLDVLSILSITCVHSVLCL